MDAEQTSSSPRGSGRLFLLTFVLILMSRIPFLVQDIGFGWDQDGWGNVQAAVDTRAAHALQCSRPPGYPLMILALAALWPLGVAAMNGVAAVSSGLAGAFFALTFRKWGGTRAASVLGGLALAFTPVVQMNSLNTLDYVPALACLTAGVCAAVYGRAALAGLALGAAAGFRITSLGALPVLLILVMTVWPRGCGFRPALKMCLACGVTSLLCYAPVVSKYGLSYIRFADQPFSTFSALVPYMMSVAAWGVTGFTGLVLALVTVVVIPWSWCSSSLAGTGQRHVMAYAAGAGIFVAGYLRLPAESAYLVPAVPFVLLLMARVLHRSVWMILCVALMASPFLAHLSVADPAAARVAAENGVVLEPGWKNRFAWRGPFLSDIRARVADMKALRSMHDAMGTLPGGKITVWAREMAKPYFLGIPELRRKLDAEGREFVFAWTGSLSNAAATLGAGDFAFCPVNKGSFFTMSFLAAREPDGSLGIQVMHFVQKTEDQRVHDIVMSDLDLLVLSSWFDPATREKIMRRLAETKLVIPLVSTGDARELVPLILWQAGVPLIPVYEHPDRLRTVRHLANDLQYTEMLAVDLPFAADHDVGLSFNYELPIEWNCTLETLRHAATSPGDGSQ